MVTTRIFVWVAALVGIVVWRSGHVAKNAIIKKHAFPKGYYAHGDFSINCQPLNGGPDLKYCEDESFWDMLDAKGKLVDRKLLLSCDSNRKSWNTVMGPLRDPVPRGSLWLYEPTSGGNTAGSEPGQSSPQLRRIELNGYPVGHEFHPLGMEAYPSYAGNTSNLYVVNHARARTVIEHFTISPSSPTVANHVRTLVSPYFHSANALALTSPDSFYVTNDHIITRRLPYIGHILPVLESVLALPIAFVSHIVLSPPSPSTTNHIAKHKFSSLFTPFPNGISISPDGTRVAIAITTLGEVRIYSRDTTTNDLTRLVDTIQVPYTPDNIHFTHDGSSLLVAGHPHFPTLTAVAANKTQVAPSWVVSIDVSETEGAQQQLLADFDEKAPISVKGKVKPVSGRKVTTIFQSDGTGFSSSSTGLIDPFTRALYVTGLYAEEGAIVCHPSSI